MFGLLLSGSSYPGSSSASGSSSSSKSSSEPPSKSPIKSAKSSVQGACQLLLQAQLPQPESEKGMELRPRSDNKRLVTAVEAWPVHLVHLHLLLPAGMRPVTAVLPAPRQALDFEQSSGGF